LLRSGTSPALNYGEAKSAESKNDFIHKMKICLKELRESFNCLRIMQRARIYNSEQQVNDLIIECNELISIFVRSIDTALKRR
jgi:four helix bundle protein